MEMRKHLPSPPDSSRFSPPPQQPGVPCTYYTELWRQSRTKDPNPWVTFKEQQLSLRNICPLEASFIICRDSLAHI